MHAMHVGITILCTGPIMQDPVLLAEVCIWSGALLLQYSLSRKEPNHGDNENTISCRCAMQSSKTMFQAAVKYLATGYRKEECQLRRTRLLFIAVAVSVKQGSSIRIAT